MVMASEKVVGKTKRGGKRPGSGRKPGTPNKVTADVREIFKGIMERNAERVEGWIQAVGDTDPYKATDLILRLAEYHVPKLARTELTGEGGGPVVIAADRLDQNA